MAKTPTKRTPTVARGAVIARAYLYKWIARERLEIDQSRGEPEFRNGYNSALFQLREWLKTQPARTKRKGGIGR